MKFTTLFRAALALIVGLLALASLGANPPTPADLIIHNANVVTLNSNAPFAAAVAIRQDRIVAVGKDGDMADWQGPLTRMIDARGRTLLPGLYDNHVQSFDASVRWDPLESTCRHASLSIL